MEDAEVMLNQRWTMALGAVISLVVWGFDSCGVAALMTHLVMSLPGQSAVCCLFIACSACLEPHLSRHQNQALPPNEQR